MSETEFIRLQDKYNTKYKYAKESKNVPRGTFLRKI